MQKRPPIVVIMGHVDHGKTTLLDYIRKTNIAAKEAGGITQSIGAYEIIHGGERITFIDTPGHEAFGALRAYGARVADLAILVVAADDGVKPQTKDAVKYINDEELPFVVVINKIDKPNANIEKVKQELSQIGVFLEGYGGNVSWNAISAKNGQGVHELLDHILLTSEVEEFTCDPKNNASGYVLSCRSDPKRGLVVGVVLRDGTLEVGQALATATASGKIRSLEDFLGKQTKLLTPSAPAVILGFEKLPKIGEEFMAGHKLTGKPTAKPVALKKVADPGTAVSEKEAMPIVLKADDGGTLEVLEDIVERIALELPLIITQSSVGNIHEGDVKMAESVGAVVVGFRVKMDKAATNIAHAKKVTVLTSPIIYELEKDLKDHLAKATSAEVRSIEVLAVFGEAKGKQRIVGGKVSLGPIRNQEPFEIWQDQRLIGQGKILNLQSERKDIAEAETGREVGLLVESEESIKVGYKLKFI
ncbi:GTP-binding protein [Candidatus Jorgensenbacteria bacterium]|nr:GTP-binding protein [Candidatus Jorgensenbacteria bacterium]